MAEKGGKKKKGGIAKMNTVELLQNKDRLKVIAQEAPELAEKVKKVEL